MRKMTLWLALGLLSFLPAFAQDQTGKIHGHVQDPATVPIADGVVTLSTDGGKTAKYTFKTDPNGDYKGDGVAAGTYTVSLRRPDTPADKVLDQLLNVKVVAGQDVLADFDMTRAEYMKNLTPEQRKLAEDTRKKNSDVLKENAQIKNLNANLAKARDDNKNKNFAEADSLMTEAVKAKPDAAVLWLELGEAQFGEKKYSDAETSLKKSVELDAAAKKQNPEIQGAANDFLGQTYAAESKAPDAQAAFDAAAKINPAGAAGYYYNEAVVFRGKDPDAVAAAADKAIAADPNGHPVVYFLKGEALVSKATVDQKTGKIEAPAGCAEAYKKYLDLAPNGPMAADAKNVLASLDSTISSSYKASSKKK